MKKSGLYTKTGDAGNTSLVGGERISKSDSRIDLYGDIDELNSTIGLVVSFITDSKIEHLENIMNILQLTQSNLFNLGSHMACLSTDWEKYKLTPIDTDFITQLESSIDLVDSKLPRLKNFVLPGGSKASSFSHLARTICRRAERKLVMFGEVDDLPGNALILLNRLSDYLFVIARYFNLQLGHTEILWKN